MPSRTQVAICNEKGQPQSFEYDRAYLFHDQEDVPWANQETIISELGQFVLKVDDDDDEEDDPRQQGRKIVFMSEFSVLQTPSFPDAKKLGMSYFTSTGFANRTSYFTSI